MPSPTMRHASVLLASLLLAAPPAAAQSTGRPGHGLIGMGISMYQPGCAYACRSSLPRSSIPCEEVHNGHHSSSVGADCLANSDAYLMSAAWCLHERCGEDNVPVADLEKFWETDLVGRELEQPLPMWTYQESLMRVVNDPPTTTLGEEEVFNRTVAVMDEDYITNWNGDQGFERVERLAQQYSLVILLTGAGIPILLSLLRFVPFPAFMTKVYSYIVEPPAFGSHHAAPVMGLAIIPTRGQALFIFYLIAINIILCSVGFRSLQPNSWYSSGSREELTNYIANRAGQISFANLPLLILYVGRNNILLWVTNWSHSTFLLLHRWIAFICMLEAVLHSALWLNLHVEFYDDHDEVAIIPYWYWGIIGTLALVIIIPLSILPLRKRFYEVFHALHIVFAILSIVGCWYHIVYRYQRQWGYENWVIMAAVVWAFDWVMRFVRVVSTGVKRGYVTRVSDDYVRIDVPGVYSKGHAYAYFPTLNWRLWESHPFSIAGLALQGMQNNTVVTTEEPVEKNAVVQGSDVAPSSSSQTRFQSTEVLGIRFFIRLEKGTTSKLAAYAGKPEGVPLLMETYSGKSLLGEAEYPNTVFVAGGVGITAILPKVTAAPKDGKAQGSRKLYWGVRHGAEGLVEGVQDMVVGTASATTTAATTVESKVVVASEGLTHLNWPAVEAQVSVGDRFDLRALLEADVAANAAEGTTVVVCGPGEMADEARAVVTSLGRHGAKVKLVEESFMW